MLLVDSKNIFLINYIREDKQLDIVFKNNLQEVYTFKNISNEIYTDFENSESKGRYFFTNIKDKYEFEKKELL